jgi:hypothetical protein
MYKDNPDVVFADVNLQDSNADLRGPPHNPGSGGWPTIRYFTAETGVEGGNYQKVTDLPMCEELLDRMTMMDYVEGVSGAALCDVATGKNCNEKEVAYLEKYKAVDADAIQTQLDRLNMMTNLKTELQQWVWRRMRILKKLQAQGKPVVAETAASEL